MNPHKVGDVLMGTVVRVYPSYAIMLFDDDVTGLLHISELSERYVRSFTGFVQTGNIYRVRVVELDESRDEMKVSIKAVGKDERRKPIARMPIREKDISFEGLALHLGEWKERHHGEKDD